MNNQMGSDVDPLSTYNLNNFPILDNFGNSTLPFGNQYPYTVKVENYQNPNYYNPLQGILPKCTQETEENTSLNPTLEDTGNEIQTQVTEQNQSNGDTNNVNNINNTEEEDIKPDITDDKFLKSKKIKKERSKYFSVKIKEKDFKFYGCSVCNVNFKELHELDNHVATHKDRLTSYDWRVKNQIKKKKMKKELKKKKKLMKSVKKEPEVKEFDIEIKPEDGYIGNEKASDFVNNTESDNQSSKENHGEVSKNTEEANDGRKQDVPTTGTGGPKQQDMLNLQKIYKCFACQKQFTLSYYLKLHVRSHTDEKPYTCPQCGQSFITASKLGRHNKRFHLAIRYQCRICYKYFSRFEFLTRHFDKKHPDDKLEGEPYDFNAILPYLKELEEQLREKAEKEKASSKPDDPWLEALDGEAKPEPDEVKEEVVEEKGGYVTVVMEPMKVDVDEVEVEVKLEEKGGEARGGDGDGDGDIGDDDGFGDDVKDESCDMKDENPSDEDYFPSNTWASKPAEDPPSRSPKSSPSDRVKCPVCEKRFSTSSYMRIHMRTHTGERPFKCYICDMGFITSSKMHRHVLTHPECWADDEVKEEKEEKAGVDIKTEEGDETEEDKKTKRKLRMKKALAKFSKKSKSTEKATRRCTKRPHSCEFCQKRFLHLETLQVHRKCHAGESVVHKCHFCLAEHPDAAARRAHEAAHQGPKPYLCTVCGRGYKKRETMIYHRKNHKPEREFICDICTKSFNAYCKLQRHIVSHSAQRFVLRYECPVCAHMFHTKYHVQMHLSTHQKEGLIQEENRNEILAMVLQNARKIPKTADAPAALSDAVPSDERSRVCNICGEVFQHFYYLEEHLKSHGSKIAIEDSEKAEEKKHICTVCNKGFKLHYYLKLHSFTHTKEKPFICQQCGKGFITRGKLKRHIETHSGLKKYQCHICYKFFTRPSYLRIHVRTIHGTQDYNFRVDKGWDQFGADYAP